MFVCIVEPMCCGTVEDLVVVAVITCCVGILLCSFSLHVCVYLVMMLIADTNFTSDSMSCACV